MILTQQQLHDALVERHGAEIQKSSTARPSASQDSADSVPISPCSSRVSASDI